MDEQDRPPRGQWKQGTREGFDAYSPGADPHALNPYAQPDPAWFNFHTGFRWAGQDNRSA